ncbi:hypothetical protein V6N13_030085 [Hibiscus sabdariffa]
MPPSAQTTEAPPVHILQLRNQLQRMKAQQLQFIEETKVFQTSSINFLCFQFPYVVTFFQPHPTTISSFNVFVAAHPSTGADKTEEVHYLSNAASDAFDWSTPFEHPPSSPAQTYAPPPLADILESSHARKRKASRGRILNEEQPPKLVTGNPDERIFPIQLKRRMRYHIITTESDEDSA